LTEVLIEDGINRHTRWYRLRFFVWPVKNDVERTFDSIGPALNRHFNAAGLVEGLTQDIIDPVESHSLDHLKTISEAVRAWDASDGGGQEHPTFCGVMVARVPSKLTFLAPDIEVLAFGFVSQVPTTPLPI
jgi:hypothetical protein